MERVTSVNLSKNIYQAVREMRGLTQENAAELIGVHVDSLRAYENNRRRPADDIVNIMVKVYEYPYLGYQHLMSSPLCDLLPEVLPYSMEQAAMRLVRLMDKFDKESQDDKLLEIAEDGLVSIDEITQYEDIMDDLDEIIEAAFALAFFAKKQKKCPTVGGTVGHKEKG